jgi:indole-3-glycerol phosphate synthase
VTILGDIARYKRQEIVEARMRKPLAVLETEARAAGKPRGFLRKLEEARATNQFALIAEVKKASPSKGLIRADFAPASIAVAYEQGGAACLSVLTDAPSFQGAPHHLASARGATTLPVLRKDFMFEPYQVVEARAWGADCILVILACVDDAEARALVETADEWDLDILVEVHDERELDRALALETAMIGINNRDLNTFVTDLGVTERLAQRIPATKLVVAESGISAYEDLMRLGYLGVTTFLVGESLMRQGDIKSATRRLLGR